MMRKMQALGLGALLLACSAPAFAQDDSSGSMGGSSKSGAESKSTMNEQDLRKVTIKVLNVDKANHQVTFEAKVDPEANVESASGQPIKIDQLKPGQEVRASFDPNTGDVKKLEVTKPGSSSGQMKQHHNMNQ